MKKIIAYIFLLSSVSTQACEVFGWFGQGSQSSIVGIQWGQGQVVTFGYYHDGEVSGAEMLADLDSQLERLEVKWIFNGMAIESISWDVDANGIINRDDWSIRGWKDKGFWAYWVKDKENSVWTSSETGAPFRPLVDGARDFWVWSENFEETAPSIKKCK